MSTTARVQTVVAENAPITAEGSITSALLQRTAPHSPESEVVPPIVNEVLRCPGKPLDADTRSFMESRFNHDFSNVRIHTENRAAESARAVNANAYTVGNHLVFDDGQYRPGTPAGDKLLAHELTHAVQQSQATTTIDSTREIKLDDSSEADAREVEGHVLQIKDCQPEVQVPSLRLQRQRRRRPAQAPEVSVRTISQNHIQIVVGVVRIGTLEVHGNTSAHNAVQIQAESSIGSTADSNGLGGEVRIEIVHSPDVEATFHPRGGSWERVAQLLEDRDVSQFRFRLTPAPRLVIHSEFAGPPLAIAAPFEIAWDRGAPAQTPRQQPVRQVTSERNRRRRRSRRRHRRQQPEIPRVLSAREDLRQTLQNVEAELLSGGLSSEEEQEIFERRNRLLSELAALDAPQPDVSAEENAPAVSEPPSEPILASFNPFEFSGEERRSRIQRLRDAHGGLAESSPERHGITDQIRAFELFEGFRTGPEAYLQRFLNSSEVQQGNYRALIEERVRLLHLLATDSDLARQELSGRNSSTDLDLIRNRLIYNAEFAHALGFDGPLLVRYRSLLNDRSIPALELAYETAALVNPAYVGYGAGYTAEERPSNARDILLEINRNPEQFLDGLVVGTGRGVLDGAVGLLRFIWDVANFDPIRITSEELYELRTNPEHLARRIRQAQTAVRLAIELEQLFEELRENPQRVLRMSGDFGITIGHALAEYENEDFMNLSTYEKGEQIGYVIGLILFEILMEVAMAIAPELLAARGPQVAASASRLIRRTPSLARAAEALAEGSPQIRRIMNILEDFERAEDFIPPTTQLNLPPSPSSSRRAASQAPAGVSAFEELFGIGTGGGAGPLPPSSQTPVPRPRSPDEMLRDVLYQRGFSSAAPTNREVNLLHRRVRQWAEQQGLDWNVAAERAETFRAYARTFPDEFIGNRPLGPVTADDVTVPIDEAHPRLHIPENIPAGTTHVPRSGTPPVSQGNIPWETHAVGDIFDASGQPIASARGSYLAEAPWLHGDDLARQQAHMPLDIPEDLVEDARRTAEVARRDADAARRTNAQNADLLEEYAGLMEDYADAADNLAVQHRGEEGSLLGPFRPDEHAEAQMLASLERQIAGRDVRGGTLRMVVTQAPCDLNSTSCRRLLNIFAERHGLNLEIFVPMDATRPGVRPQTVASRWTRYGIRIEGSGRGDITVTPWSP